MKRFIIAVMFAAMAVVATDARADDINISFPGLNNTFFINALHTEPGAFTDTFTFTNASLPYPLLANVFLSTFSLLGSQDNIDFTSATLNGVGLSLSPTGVFQTVSTFSPINLAGPSPFALVVSGTTGASNGVFSSYAGALNLAPVVQTIPEPASLMLLGAGLAAIGIWRRKAAR